jgi:ligand-binding SRPBCC domain-containing protein
MPVSVDELFDFHMDAANLSAISPPFPPFQLVDATKRAEQGDLQVMRIGFGRIAVMWEARIIRVVPGRLLEDVQERGPFLKWRHQHRFAADGDESLLTDVVSFRLLPTLVGEFLEYLLIRPTIIGMFAYRHRKTRAILGHSKF